MKRSLTIVACSIGVSLPYAVSAQTYVERGVICVGPNYHSAKYGDDYNAMRADSIIVKDDAHVQQSFRWFSEQWSHNRPADTWKCRLFDGGNADYVAYGNYLHQNGFLDLRTADQLEVFPNGTYSPHNLTGM